MKVLELETDNWKLTWVLADPTATRRACAHPWRPLALLPSGPDAVRDPWGLHKFRAAVRPAKITGPPQCDRTNGQFNTGCSKLPKLPER